MTCPSCQRSTRDGWTDYSTASLIVVQSVAGHSVYTSILGVPGSLICIAYMNYVIFGLDVGPSLCVMILVLVTSG
jgi:hypothetical protein